MKTITLEEFERDRIAVIARAQAGESFLVLDGQCGAFEVRPATIPRTSPRPFGLCRGEFTVPDSFDEPLPAGTFEGIDSGPEPDELRPEYDVAELGPGVRGKYYERALKVRETLSAEPPSPEAPAD